MNMCDTLPLIFLLQDGFIFASRLACVCASVRQSVKHMTLRHGASYVNMGASQNRVPLNHPQY